MFKVAVISPFGPSVSLAGGPSLLSLSYHILGGLSETVPENILSLCPFSLCGNIAG